MGKHLDKLAKLGEISTEFQNATEKLLEIVKIIGQKEKLGKDLSSFGLAYAWLDYQFSIYLLQIFPNVVKSDEIDKNFNNIMKNFGKME